MTKTFAGKHATSSLGDAGLEVKGDALGIADAASSRGVERLLRDSDGAAILACSKATWWRRVADGTLPQPIRIGGMSRWKLSEVFAAIERLSTPKAPKR